MFTLHKPSMIPFLQYSEKRELREKIYTAYINRGNHGDELDNKETLAKMAALRIEGDSLLLAVNNQFAKEWVSSSSSG